MFVTAVNCASCQVGSSGNSAGTYLVESVVVCFEGECLKNRLGVRRCTFGGSPLDYRTKSRHSQFGLAIKFRDTGIICFIIYKVVSIKIGENS